MTTHRDIASSETDPFAPIVAALMKALALNTVAIAEGATGAPYVATGWHPYNGVNVGDAATGIIYKLSLIHISEPTRPVCSSRMPSSA